MSSWERFLYRGLVSGFTGELVMGKIEHNRRFTDEVTDVQVKKLAGNGQTTKELIARNTLENAIAHEKINTKLEVQGAKLKWHDKVIMAILITGITSVVAGFIGLGIWIFKFIIERI